MLNCVILIGRLTAEPTLKSTITGKEVTSFSIAVDRSYTKPGEQRTADFINIVAWEQTARFVCNYFKKGSMIGIQGKIQTRTFEKDGTKRTAFEVVAQEVSFCGGNEGKSKSKVEPLICDGTGGFSTAMPEDFEEIVEDELDV